MKMILKIYSKMIDFIIYIYYRHMNYYTPQKNEPGSAFIQFGAIYGLITIFILTIIDSYYYNCDYFSNLQNENIFYRRAIYGLLVLYVYIILYLYYKFNKIIIFKKFDNFRNETFEEKKKKKFWVFYYYFILILILVVVFTVNIIFFSCYD